MELDRLATTTGQAAVMLANRSAGTAGALARLKQRFHSRHY
jgi:hypothetical protein